MGKKLCALAVLGVLLIGCLGACGEKSNDWRAKDVQAHGMRFLCIPFVTATAMESVTCKELFRNLTTLRIWGSMVSG